MTGLVTKQSDVYSFGMVLFEVLCSKLCTVTDKDGGFMFDAQTVKDLYTNNKLDEIIDRDLRKQMNMTALRKFSAIAYRCLLDRKDRPLMDVVKNELEETLKIEGEVSKKKLDAETSKSLPGAHRFSLAEINHATDEFAPKNKLTQGGFGGAFRGNISGKEVVVWRMTKEKGPRIQTFYDLLSVCNHVNFISLGYCDEEEEKILVYEQMTHGASLYDCLFRHTNFIPRLSVEQRLEICIGVAKGLSHLHSLTNTIILKPHVKTANVYLDRNLVPKITSFNSFNFDVRPSESSWSLERVYLAPERFIPNYPYSPKVDVYAFGVVLLEVLLEKSLMILPAFIMPGQLHMFVKLNIYGECIRECESVIRLCLEHDPARRPFMNEVVDRLEHALQLQKQWIGGT
ncbi:hypothetical protein QVD17_05242 [Tagetes erecta]|uniref:Protein kinase domain-containing protein n=1 Tax=Tagetes erecta TaxID=13708 RepID=A0AAD8LBM9_TARER|nr:hypothetical protein QVD17_05242 [Tagetes erecta]